jgi:hypothetical protein
MGSVGAIDERDAGRKMARDADGVFSAKVAMPLIRAGSCSHSERALLSRKRVETGRAVAAHCGQYGDNSAALIIC